MSEEPKRLKKMMVAERIVSEEPKHNCNKYLHFIRQIWRIEMKGMVYYNIYKCIKCGERKERLV